MSDNVQPSNPRDTSIDAPHDKVADSPPEKKGLSQRTIVIVAIVAAVALIAGLVWFISYRTHGRYIQSTNNAFLHADTVTVSPKVAGYVVHVLVTDDQLVREGQPLVEIDRGSLETAVASAEADVRAREADLARLADGARSQQAQVARQVAESDVAQSVAAQASRESTRATALADTGTDTDKNRDDAVAALEQARGRARAARAAALAARREYESFGSQREQALAGVSSARAALRAKQLDLQSTVVTASRAGRVGDRAAQPGQYVQPGARLMTLVVSDSLELVANFKETQVGAIRPGQRAEVKLDAFQGRAFEGVVLSLSPGTGAQFALLPPENATGNFTKVVQRVPVRIRLLAPADLKDRLLPGLSAEVSIDTKDEVLSQNAALRR